jgi:hypothetical protein
VQPDHDVGIRAHGGNIVASAVGHSVLRQTREQGVEVVGSIGAAEDLGGALEDGPEGEELLG